MNIVIFTNAYKPIISGVVNCIDLMRKNLVKKGHDVVIFAPDFPGYTDTEDHVYRYPSLNLTNKVKFPIPIPFFPVADKILKSKEIDIIHCHHPFILGEEGAKWAAKLNVPLFFTFHTQYEQYAHYVPLPAGLVKEASKALVSAYAKKCDVIITPGSAIIEELKNYGVEKNVVYMPNSIDLDDFTDPDSTGIREKYNVKPDEKLLVYVGRMAQEKNIPFMLDAFRIIQEQIASKLMIIGEGPELENFRSYAKEKNIDESVIFTGRIEYKDIPAYYGAADTFIMTSTTEVLPLALLEAMAAGLPIIAVNACGISDTVIDGENGAITEEDRDKFAQAVIKVISDNETLKKMSLKSIEISEKYSADKMTDRLLELYTEASQKKKIEISS